MSETLWGGCYDHGEIDNTCVECTHAQLAQAQARIRSLEETNQALQAREQHAIEHGQARIRELEGEVATTRRHWEDALHEHAARGLRINSLERDLSLMTAARDELLRLEEKGCTPEERAVLDACAMLGLPALHYEDDARLQGGWAGVARAELARRAAGKGGT